MSMINEAEWHNLHERSMVYFYLDFLRDSGETNMFGAGEYLRAEFDMTKKHSHQALSDWMKSKEKS